MNAERPKVLPAPPSGGSAVVDRQSHAAWLASEVERLETLIKPAPAKVIDDAVDLVLEGHGGRATNEAKAAAYVIALEGISAAAIGRGVKDVLQGRVAGIDVRFPPSAPQLARACREHDERAVAEYRRRREELERERLPPPVEPSAEEQRRVAEGMRALAAELRAEAAQSSLGEAVAEALSAAVGDVDERVRRDG